MRFAYYARAQLDSLSTSILDDVARQEMIPRAVAALTAQVVRSRGLEGQNALRNMQSASALAQSAGVARMFAVRSALSSALTSTSTTGPGAGAAAGAVSLYAEPSL